METIRFHCAGLSLNSFGMVSRRRRMPRLRRRGTWGVSTVKTYSTQFEIFTPLPSALNQRGHWSKMASKNKRHRENSRLRTMSFLNLCGCSPDEKITVTFTRVGRALDSDNLQGAFKSVRDGVADAFGINDNSPRWIFDYGQRPKSKTDAPGLTGIVSISFEVGK
jgi:hypothetical protein